MMGKRRVEKKGVKMVVVMEPQMDVKWDGKKVGMLALK